MPSTKKIKGLANNLVQQYFSSLFWYDDGHMEDHIWDVYRATKLPSLTIDILNQMVVPAAYQTKPIISHLDTLQYTIKNNLHINGFNTNFIISAKFDIEVVYEKRTLFIVATLVDADGKTYISKTYQEKKFPNSP